MDLGPSSKVGLNLLLCLIEDLDCFQSWYASWYGWLKDLLILVLVEEQYESRVPGDGNMQYLSSFGVQMQCLFCVWVFFGTHPHFCVFNSSMWKYAKKKFLIDAC
jgi:hypothetical protein